MLIPNARIGWPKLFRAEAVKNDPQAKARYGCAIYLPKSDRATCAKLDAEVNRLSKEKLKGVRPKAKDLCIRDGDGEDGDENTKGCWIISANRQEKQGRPQVIDRNRSPLAEEDAKIYAGCYCNFLIGLYVPKGWAKITASLEIVQFVKDGEPFGAGRPDTGVMPELDGEDGGDGFEV